MSIDHSKIGANIRNYNELNKGSQYQYVGEWINPSALAYGLPPLKLVPLSNMSSSNTNRSIEGKENKVYFPVKSHEDRNFLLGSAFAALLLVLMIAVYHSTTTTPSNPQVLQNEYIDIDNSRLNHSPESFLTNNEVNPELIPGVKKEEEIASCALIVGSFSRRSNAIEMQQKVLAAGYQLYTEEFQDFYRVGVSMDCADIKGAAFLAVEAKLGIDPWLHISF